MNTKDNSENEDKICPHCRKTFSSHSVRNRHLQRGVCVKPGSPAEPPAVILNEDHEGLLVGHTCPYSKYNCYSLPLGLVITIYLTSGTEYPSSLTSPTLRSILPSVPALSQEGSVSAPPQTLTWLGLTSCWQQRTMVSRRYQFQRKVNYSFRFIWFKHIYLIRSSNIFGRKDC